VPPPVAQIQITPLLDVLLVLLVLGLLAWAASRVSARTSVQQVAPVPLLQGLTLPLQGATDASRPIVPSEASALVGVGAQGQLSWRGVPVTRDILTLQLRRARELDPRVEVWLAVDEALPYADLMTWLDWLQLQQVSRLTLLSRSQPPAQSPGKP
jgi:biopolymer transport protein ExbD